MNGYEEGKIYTGSRGGKFIVRRSSRGSTQGKLIKVYVGGTKRQRSPSASSSSSSSSSSGSSLFNASGKIRPKKLAVFRQRLNDEWPKQPMFNQSLDGYTLREKLGEGMYGVVNRAIRKRDGKVVAIKRMPFFNDPHVIEPKVMAEIHQNADLKKNPHIISILGAGKIDAGDEPANSETFDFFLVYPLLEGDLQALLAAGKLTQAEFKSLFIQYLLGVHALHHAGYVHRDLHAGNLFYRKNKVTGEYIGVVGDLGLTCHETIEFIKCDNSDFSREDLIYDDTHKMSNLFKVHRKPPLTKKEQERLSKIEDIQSLYNFVVTFP